MVEEKCKELHASAIDEEAFLVEPGCGTSASGATHEVMGAETRKEWQPPLRQKGLLQSAPLEKCRKQFRSGNHQFLASTMAMRLPVSLCGTEKDD